MMLVFVVGLAIDCLNCPRAVRSVVFKVFGHHDCGGVLFLEKTILVLRLVGLSRTAMYFVPAWSCQFAYANEAHAVDVGRVSCGGQRVVWCVNS